MPRHTQHSRSSRSSRPSWHGLAGVAIGFGASILIGLYFGIMTISTAIGMAFGAAFGIILIVLIARYRS